MTLGALTTAANLIAIRYQSRVCDSGIVSTTKGAMHGINLSSKIGRWDVANIQAYTTLKQNRSIL